MYWNGEGRGYSFDGCVSTRGSILPLYNVPLEGRGYNNIMKSVKFTVNEARYFPLPRFSAGVSRNSYFFLLLHRRFSFHPN